MEKKRLTPFAEFKQIIELEIKNNKGLNSYQAGYKQCCIDMINLINEHYFTIEKLEIIKSYIKSFEERHNPYKTGVHYYEETFTN